MTHPCLHMQDVLNISEDTDDAKTHQQGKCGSCNHAGVLGKPHKDSIMKLEGEERFIGRCGQQITNGDASADDAHNERYHHRHLVAADGCLLMLFEILHSIETFRQCSHEVGTVVEMWFLCEEQFLKFFIFFHNQFGPPNPL